MGIRIADKPVGEMRPGDHAAFSFTTEHQQAQVIGPFVRAGLNLGDKVIYVTAAGTERLPGLRGGADVERSAATGRLRLIPQTALRGAGGRFDPALMRALVTEEIVDAMRRGHRAVRLTADMSWVLTDPDGLTRLLASEAGFEEAIEHHVPLMAICQLNADRCPPDRLGALTEVHPILVTPDPEFDDGVLRVIRRYDPGGLRLSGEIDAARHQPLLAALASLGEEDGAIHLDFAAVRFVDLATLSLLVTYAARLRTGRTIVLDDLPPDAADLIETLGWRHLPGLTRGRSRRT
jgi:anti-anti-sigma regulatory factor